jgi:hypothetical protein
MSARTREIPGVGHGGGVDDGDDGGGERALQDLAAEVLHNQFLVCWVESEPRWQLPRRRLPCCCHWPPLHDSYCFLGSRS